MMKQLLERCKQLGLGGTAVINQLPPGAADDVFQVAFKSLMESDAENGTSRRLVELSYGTVYNVLMKRK